MAPSSSLFTQVVRVSEEYLGPAGERFMRRQVTTHLGIEPEELNRRHLPQLVEWIRLAFAMLSNDKKEVEEFSRSLLELSKTTKAR